MDKVPSSYVGVRAAHLTVRCHLKVYAVFWLALALSGCAVDAFPVETPVEVVGTVTNPKATGWTRDFCDEGRPVLSAPNCAQIGGEIYRATLINVRAPDRRLIAKKLTIGFPAHALTRKYRGTKRLRLERAPDDFRNATGIAVLATDWSDT
jgi:hypothetical protein